MFDLATVILAAEEMPITPGPMWAHPIVFGLVAFAILMVIGLVTFSFRNMAYSHPKRSAVIQAEPVGHPGTPILESGHDAH